MTRTITPASSVLHCSTPSYTALHHHTRLYTIIHGSTPSYTALHHHTRLYTIIHGRTVIHGATLSYTALHHHTRSYTVIHGATPSYTRCYITYTVNITVLHEHYQLLSLTQSRNTRMQMTQHNSRGIEA